MSLTKNDLQQIEKLINRSLFESFEKILIPYVDASITSLKLEMDDKFAEINLKFEQIDEQFRELRGEMNEHFAIVHSRIDEAIALNGRYYEDCAKKEDLQALELRIEKLEAVR